MKEIAAFEPYSENVDIAEFGYQSARNLCSTKGRRTNRLSTKIQRAGKGVIVNSGGYIDLRDSRPFPNTCFKLRLTAKADGPGKVPSFTLVSQHSEVDPRQKVQDLGSHRY